MTTPIRIQKIMADSGYCSRRAAEKLIADGKVTVNGHPCKLGDKAIPGKDLLAVGGEKICGEKKRTLYYLMLYKPRGYVTTMHDELDRKTVSELVTDVPARVYPVGRLDRNSEGLLLMTNDGDLTNRLTHPSYQVAKQYRVTVRGAVSDRQAADLAGGVMLDDGRTEEAGVRILETEPERTVMEIVIHEGRNRQIRRMCEAVGLEVVRLKRNMEGPLRLGMLQPGKWRYLTDEEVAALKRCTRTASPAPKKRRK